MPRSGRTRNSIDSQNESVISKGAVYDNALLDCVEHLTSFVLQTLLKGQSDFRESSWSPRMLGLYSELTSLVRSKPSRTEDLALHELCI